MPPPVQERPLCAAVRERDSGVKFRRRFGWLEEQLRQQGKNLEESSLDEMETLWQQAKTVEEGLK